MILLWLTYRKFDKISVKSKHQGNRPESKKTVKWRMIKNRPRRRSTRGSYFRNIKDNSVSIKTN